MAERPRLVWMMRRKASNSYQKSHPFATSRSDRYLREGDGWNDVGRSLKITNLHVAVAIAAYVRGDDRKSAVILWDRQF